MVLLGAPVEGDPKHWKPLAKVVSGWIVNGYCRFVGPRNTMLAEGAIAMEGWRVAPGGHLAHPGARAETPQRPLYRWPSNFGLATCKEGETTASQENPFRYPLVLFLAKFIQILSRSVSFFGLFGLVGLDPSLWNSRRPALFLAGVCLSVS